MACVINFASSKSFASAKRPSFEDIQMNWYLKQPEKSQNATEKQTSLAQRLAHWWYGPNAKPEQNTPLSQCQTKLKLLLKQVNEAKTNESKWKQKYNALQTQVATAVAPSTFFGEGLAKESFSERNLLERTVKTYIEGSLNYLEKYPDAQSKFTFGITGAKKNDLPNDQRIEYIDKNTQSRIAIFTLHQDQSNPTQFTLTGKLTEKTQK